MATSLRLLRTLGQRTWHFSKINRPSRPFSGSRRRFLLSGSYSCNEAWKDHLNDPNLAQVTLSEFGYELREQLEREGNVSAVDLNVLAHQLGRMDDDEADFVEDLLSRFNMCQSSIPRNESTSHAIVRSFLSKKQDGASRLVRMLSERSLFGLFPDHYTLNLLVDHLIESRDLAGAARVAYHSMLQEDLSSCPASHTLLCLHAAVSRLLQGPISDIAPPAVDSAGDEEEEEDWIKVKYIKFPVYDDHFDIKDERFLLGKTLYALAQVLNVKLPEHMRTSLSVIGSGLHHKFNRGLNFLQTLVDSPTAKVSQHALELFTESLDTVEARDPQEPEVELALRTVDDVIHRMLPTTTEKEEFQTRLGRIKEQLASQGKVESDFDLGKTVAQLVNSELPSLEPDDVQAQLVKFDSWREERACELSRQVEALRREERLEEMRHQVKELQEREELLSYFDHEEKVRLTFLDDDLEKDESLTVSK